jgi:hypothetical protein
VLVHALLDEVVIGFAEIVCLLFGARDMLTVITNPDVAMDDLRAREEKWQSGRCRFEVQVCDSGWALAAAR